MNVRFVILSFLLNACLPYLIYGENTSECRKEMKYISYLDIAMEMIKNAKDHNCSKELVRPSDCEEVLRAGNKVSGVYTVYPRSRVLKGKSVEVFCDMDTDGGGWTLIQRRGNFSTDYSEDYFSRYWRPYKNGFGDLEKEFWLGNDNICALSNQELYSIRFDLKDVQGNKAYALYDTFWIDDEDHNYTIHIESYSGNAGDAMARLHKQAFTTKDRDNDKDEKRNCAVTFGGGWWYQSCFYANLNGLRLQRKQNVQGEGIIWALWKGKEESLDTTEIKIRSRNFRN